MLKLCAKQVDNRQASRFNEFLKETFGGRQCIQSYLKDRTFQQWNDNEEVQCNRILPVLGHGILCKTKPDSDIKRYSNRKNWWTQAAARRRYFEGLARDLADPNSAKAQARKTRRFAGLLHRMDDARESKAYFHDPSHKGDKGKGKGKGKEMTPMPGLGDQLEQVQLEQIIDATAPPHSASAPRRIPMPGIFAGSP